MGKPRCLAVSLFLAVLCVLPAPSALLARPHAKRECFTGLVDSSYGLPIGTSLTVCFEGYPAASAIGAIHGLEAEPLQKAISKLHYGYIRQSGQQGFTLPIQWTMRVHGGRATRMAGLGLSSSWPGLKAYPGERPPRVRRPLAYPYFVVAVVQSQGLISGTLWPDASVAFDRQGWFVMVDAGPPMHVRSMHATKPY